MDTRRIERYNSKEEPETMIPRVSPRTISAASRQPEGEESTRRRDELLRLLSKSLTTKSSVWVMLSQDDVIAELQRDAYRPKQQPVLKFTLKAMVISPVSAASQPAYSTYPLFKMGKPPACGTTNRQLKAHAANTS